MDYREFTGKTVEDAITAACTEFIITSDKLDYEVLDNGSSGFLGIGSKPAVIKAKVKTDDKTTKKPEKKNDKPAQKKEISSEVKKEEVKSDIKKVAEAVDKDAVIKEAEKFLSDVFKSMSLDVVIKSEYFESEAELDIELSGKEMGVLIGKRGQTLDSLQYLTSLVVNKGTSSYIRVKVDTEDYRRRRKDTLENLARNLSYKVKRTKRSVTLEPMNPYERRIIHSSLQNDKYVTTYSEGEEPYRKVVIALKKDGRN